MYRISESRKKIYSQALWESLYSKEFIDSQIFTKIGGWVQVNK